MVIIAGCVIKRDNKILMVKEAKKKCYGKWNFPAGHVDEFETIPEAAIREVFEETGCKVKLTGVLPIATDYKETETFFHIRFTAETVEENIKFDTEEILDVKWIDIEELKNMTDAELRGVNTSKDFIKYVEENRVYPVELFNGKLYRKE